MRLKLDENLGPRVAALFRSAGHDAATVIGESLGGASDQQIYAAAITERRCLITLDLDFANLLRFPPAKANGIVVLRPARRSTETAILSLAAQFVSQLERSTPSGSWNPGAFGFDLATTTELVRLRVKRRSRPCARTRGSRNSSARPPCWETGRN